MSRAGIALGLLLGAVAALQIGAALRLHTGGLSFAACGPCHDGTLLQLPMR